MFRSYLPLLVIFCFELLGIYGCSWLVDTTFDYLGFWPAVYAGMVGTITLTLIVGYMLQRALRKF